VNQEPIVVPGQRFKKGDVLAVYRQVTDKVLKKGETL